jgi:hypothetical protein
MAVENYSFKITNDTGLEIEDVARAVPNWMQQAVSLGLLVNRGEIYQQLGKDYLRISIRDIDPLPKPNERDLAAKLLTFEIGSDVYSDVRHAGFAYFEDWLSRSVALRLRAPQIGLFHQVKGQYMKIDFSANS